MVLLRADQLIRSSVQPYISSILEALMEPTSRGFAEVRDVFFRELVEVSKNMINHDGKDKLGEHMEKLSMLAFHPVKMHSCYEKVEQLSLDGLQQRFHFSSPSVFIHRAQILMRGEMDNAVYTFEQLLHQALGSQGEEDLCKAIQGCQDRVLKKYDYDSSSVRKRFFREALLQIIIPYMLQQLSPTFSNDLPRFQELIFEDFSRFILVENVFEEVVLQAVTKDIMMAVKEAAVQKRHNLYRDSIIMTNSDPNLHLLGENPVDWSQEYGGDNPDNLATLRDGGGGGSSRRRRQVVSMIQSDGMLLPYESCMEVPGVEGIPEENEAQMEEEEDGEGKGKLESPKMPSSLTTTSAALEAAMSCQLEPESPDSVQEIRALINPVVEVLVPAASKSADSDTPILTNRVESLEEGEEVQKESGAVPPKEEEPRSAEEQQDTEQYTQEGRFQQEDQDGELPAEIAVAIDCNSNPSSYHHDDSGFQSPTNEALEEEEDEHEKTEPVKTIVADPKEILLDVLQPHSTDVSPTEMVQNREHTRDVLL
ncbi:hypothetical protein ACEWY4_003919 [Coilia grayii]|uniref:Niban 1/2/3 domain-containing protein n=1 Tax=Coilia grayii TaxID=363190 RepID=A0ABD1KK31_9TELE